MQTTLEQLIRNDSDFEYLKLEDLVFDVAALIKAIRCNKTVKSVMIQLPFPLELNVTQKRLLLEAIGGLPKLERLHVEFFWLDSRALQDFVAALQRNRPNLQEFCFWHLSLANAVQLDPLVTTLSSLSSLRSVSLGINDIQENPAVLCEASLVFLCHNPRLETLRISNLGLSYELIDVFSHGLEMNRNLRRLELNDEDLSTSNWRLMAQIFRSNTSLEQFSIFDVTGMGDDAAIAISDSLMSNSTLKSFSIENEHDTLTNYGIISLAEMLRENKGLETFCLSSMALDDDAAVAFSQVIEQNSTLKDLELGTYYGKIGNRGVSAIVEMLPKNLTLQKLSLSCQQGLMDRGMFAIATALESNNTLKHMIIEGDDDAVSTDGHEAIVNMLQKNTSLETIYHDNAGDLKVKMEFYLKLNQAGLRNLSLNVNATKAQLVEALISHQHDLDCLYYVISQNPLMVHAADNYV